MSRRPTSAKHESLGTVTAELGVWTTFVLRSSGRLVGSVRGRLDGTEWLVGRLMVAPDLQGHGLGRWMLQRVEEAAPPDARTVGVITGARSEDNLRMYRRAGFRPIREQRDPRLTRLSKRRRDRRTRADG